MIENVREMFGRGGYGTVHPLNFCPCGERFCSVPSFHRDWPPKATALVPMDQNLKPQNLWAHITFFACKMTVSSVQRPKADWYTPKEGLQYNKDWRYSSSLQAGEFRRWYSIVLWLKKKKKLTVHPTSSGVLYAFNVFLQRILKSTALLYTIVKCFISIL